MLHQNLSDHVFVVEPAHSAIRCRVCGFTLSDLAMNEFGVSRDDLFFEENDALDSGGMAVNYNNLSANLKEKYIPEFSKQLYDSGAFLTNLKNETIEAERQIKSDLEEDLFHGLEYNEKGEIIKKYSEELMNPIGL